MKGLDHFPRLSREVREVAELQWRHHDDLVIAHDFAKDRALAAAALMVWQLCVVDDFAGLSFTDTRGRAYGELLPFHCPHLGFHAKPKYAVRPLPYKEWLSAN